VILNKKHKRTWMRWAPRTLYRKPAACRESRAADCFPGRQTSRRTMTFVCPPKGGSKKCRGSLQELMRCSRWANWTSEPDKAEVMVWPWTGCCMTYNIWTGYNDSYKNYIYGVLSKWSNYEVFSFGEQVFIKMIIRLQTIPPQSGLKPTIISIID